MNTIHLTTELCAEDRARLDTLIQELRVISDTAELIRLAITNGTIPAAAPVVAADQPEPTPQADLYDEDGGEITPEPSVPWATMADIQKKVVDLSTAGKKDTVKAIIQQYAPKVSAIPEDKYFEVYKKLTELEG